MQITAERISARNLTVAAYISFVPIGVATVLLGPMLPVLSARWVLNYSQAGRLWIAQYVASTIAVAVSGAIVSWRGFRFAIQAGLLLVAFGLALMLAGSTLLGVLCIAAYGTGLGIAVPAGNLMVAELNPESRSAKLNLLNFFWSAGAVSGPFMVAAASKAQHVPLLLVFIAGFSLIVTLAMAAIPGTSMAEASTDRQSAKTLSFIQQHFRSFLILALLFLIYVGTENSFGGWMATFAKNLGTLSSTTSLMTPSFFYASLMFGRWLAPFLLRSIDEIKLAQLGLLLACVTGTGLIFSHGFAAVVGSACATGLGLAAVYPITISLLSKRFGTKSVRIGSIMFVLSNIGGGILPWTVGVVSNHFGTVKTGLVVPLIGCAVMLILYLQPAHHASEAN